MSYRRILIAVVAFGLLAAACSNDDGSSTTTLAGEGSPALAIQDGDLVEVHYVGTLDDGSQFESSRESGQTFTFTVGTGQVIPGFDDAVRGAKAGDVKTVRIEAADAYGEWTEDNVVVVPFNPEQGDVAVGDEVYLTNGQSAVVLDVTPEEVTLDANHPLAGEALTFEIEIISVTRDE
jgi:FKBP-type peptidyl-prolyl cis-trans isomerase 2